MNERMQKDTTFQKDSTPGEDGFTVEFHTFFVIPKEDGSLLDRLRCSMLILKSKAIAKRFELTMPNLIHSD